MESGTERLHALEPFWGVWYLDEMLGEGGYGKVFRVRREGISKDIFAALKWIPLPKSAGEVKGLRSEGMDDSQIRTYYSGFVRQLGREIELMSQLRGHSNIVSYEDHLVLERRDSVGWDILIRMELLTSLGDHIQKGYTEDDVFAIGIDMCKALTLLARHRIIHRDIKPDNIFYAESGNYKLGDFGVAREMEKTMASYTRLGTPVYMAPEVYLNKTYDATVDIYSLGLVLYRLLNLQKMPFLSTENPVPTHQEREQASTARLSGKALPPPLYGNPQMKAAILKACSYEPSKRFQTAEAFQEALEKARASGQTAPPMRGTRKGGSVSDRKSLLLSGGISGQPPARDMATVPAFAPPPVRPTAPQNPSEPKAPEPGSHAKMIPWIAGAGVALVGIIVVAALLLSRPAPAPAIVPVPTEVLLAEGPAPSDAPEIVETANLEPTEASATPTPIPEEPETASPTEAPVITEAPDVTPEIFVAEGAGGEATALEPQKEPAEIAEEPGVTEEHAAEDPTEGPRTLSQLFGARGTAAPEPTAAALTATEERLEKADELNWAGDLDGAEAEYLLAIQEDPTSAVALSDYAFFLAFDREDPEKSRDYYLRAIAVDASFSPALAGYARVMDDFFGEYEEARKYYQRAIEADPENAGALNNYAILLENVYEDYDGAQRYYLRAVEAAPTDRTILTNYALLLEGYYQDYDGAKEYYLRAIEADPTYTTALRDYADLLQYHFEDYDGAKAYLQQAVDLEPSNPEVLRDLAFLLDVHYEDYAAAEPYYVRAIELNPNDARAIAHYATMLEDIKEFDQAETYYLRALEVDPESGLALNNYALFLLDIRENPAKALEYIEQAATLYPEYETYQNNYEYILNAQNP